MTQSVKYRKSGTANNGLIRPRHAGVSCWIRQPRLLGRKPRMTTDEGILIISTAVDVATDVVVEILNQRGAKAVRVNTEDLPFDGSLNIDYRSSRAALLEFSGRKVCPRSIWYRRLRTPPKPKGMDEGIYDFCLRENRAGLVGGLLTQQVRWMNHPSAVWQAELKPYQLQVAQMVGLAIPPTLISNDPGAIAHF